MIDFSKFNFPSQWGEASDFWSKMLETGQPTDISPWWKSQQQAAGTQIERAGKEAAEQFGLGGMRYSTPLGQQLGRIGAETTAGIMPQYWQMGMQAQEAARGRQMSSAQNLMGVGGEMGRFPLEVGERMLGMGGEYQRQQMQSMYPMMQEFARMTPEQSPWLQMGQQFPYGQFGQMPQMYQQSPFGQMMGVGANMPWGDMLGGGQGGGQGGGSEIPWGPIFSGLATAISSIQFKKDVSEISDEDEEKIFKKMKDTPIFKYRYKFEDDKTTPHLGLITEESPSELTLFDNKAVGLYEYISTLHAMIKVLSRKIEQLEN